MIFNILVFILSFMFCLTLSVAFCPAQANCLSLGEINSSQLVIIIIIKTNSRTGYGQLNNLVGIILKLQVGHPARHGTHLGH